MFERGAQQRAKRLQIVACPKARPVRNYDDEAFEAVLATQAGPLPPLRTAVGAELTPKITDAVLLTGEGPTMDQAANQLSVRLGAFKYAAAAWKPKPAEPHRIQEHAIARCQAPSQT